MDFMFEDEVDEVGSDVEAYCPKCKADTTHVVISKYEDEIRRVQCNPCGDVHSFRKPRGEVEDDVPEPIAAKKRAMLKKPNWEEFFAKHGEKQGKPYEFRERYSENLIVTHPKFGRGFVSEVMSDSKVEITFKDARRVLVHNRKDMPGLPLAAEGDGIPSDGPKAKAVKNKAAKEAKESVKESKDSKDKESKEAREAERSERSEKEEKLATKSAPPPGSAKAAPSSKVETKPESVLKKPSAKPPKVEAKIEAKPEAKQDKAKTELGHAAKKTQEKAHEKPRDKAHEKAHDKAHDKPAKGAVAKPAKSESKSEKAKPVLKPAKAKKPAAAVSSGKSSKKR